MKLGGKVILSTVIKYYFVFMKSNKHFNDIKNEYNLKQVKCCFKAFVKWEF